MTEFRGIMFEHGWPSVSMGDREFARDFGTSYPWPDEGYRNLARSGLEGLAQALLEKTRKHMAEFGARAEIGKPSLQVGMDGLIYHIATDGGWFTLYKDNFAGFASCHNLDFPWHYFTAFNTASDAVELLKPGRLAPRVLLEGGEAVVRYFLPGPFDEDKLRGYIRSGVFEKNIFPHIRLDARVLSSEVGDGRVRMDIGKGVISIGGDVCEARGFNIHEAHKATSVVATLFYGLYRC
jgi:hypothetical protein